MSHIKTIDFEEASVASGEPTLLVIHYEADADDEQITLETLVSGVTVSPGSVATKAGEHKQPFSVQLHRGTFTGNNVLVEATIMIDDDHGSSAFDNIGLV